MGRIIFVTGTDTGVGKTLLTALLLSFWRQRGVHALAMKPFCTGDRKDVALLQALQPGELSDDVVNPFWFKEPLAPLIAARRERRRIRLQAALAKVCTVASGCEILLVEGIGGVLVPLTEKVAIADFAAALDCDVVVVGSDKLGTINHARLTVEALETRRIRRCKVVLMGQFKPDASARENVRCLQQIIANIEVLLVPFLGAEASQPEVMKKSAKKNQKLLARICDFASLSPVLWNGAENRFRQDAD